MARSDAGARHIEAQRRAIEDRGGQPCRPVALRLGPLPTQSEAAPSPPPDQGADVVHLGRQRPPRVAGLRQGLLQHDPGRAHDGRRAGRACATRRAARRLRCRCHELRRLKETPMKTWFFTEDAYPYLPDPAGYESIRVNLPNGHYDPVNGADLYHMYLDMWLAAEDHELEIMVNEHHQTATCVVPAAPLLLAILARQSKTARLLILGNPIANRNQPVRVAEEMAMIDVISRGRLECGFVRSVTWEASAANIAAVRDANIMWKAHVIIL